MIKVMQMNLYHLKTQFFSFVNGGDDRTRSGEGLERSVVVKLQITSRGLLTIGLDDKLHVKHSGI